jgi:hypothetical protein
VDDDEIQAVLDEFGPLLKCPVLTREQRALARQRLAEFGLSAPIRRWIWAFISWGRAEFRDSSSKARDDGFRDGLRFAAENFGLAHKDSPTLVVNAHSNATATGATSMDDKIHIGGDVTGSAVGSHARFKARDVVSYKNAVDNTSMDDDVKAFLKQTAEAIERASLSEDDAEDAGDALAKLTAELEKPEKNASRVARLWGNIKAIVPTVSSLLAGAASVAKIIESAQSHAPPH